jgi:hypothetical protein
LGGAGGGGGISSTRLALGFKVFRVVGGGEIIPKKKTNLMYIRYNP